MSLVDKAIIDMAPGQHAERVALLMLPGAKNTPQQLVEQGFVRAMRERHLPVDAIALDAHADHYLERKHIERLLHGAVDDVKARGYRRIWLMGISLGGLGSMLCVTQRAADVEGALVLAPFLGTSGLIAEVAEAGGLHRWQMKEGDHTDYERAFLAHLQAHPFHAPQSPRVYLGYGREDRFIGSSELLSQLLPQERVLTLQGEHDWDTWRRLWSGLLDMNPFILP